MVDMSEKLGHPSSLQLCSAEPRKENNTVLLEKLKKKQYKKNIKHNTIQFINPKLYVPRWVNCILHPRRPKFIFWRVCCPHLREISPRECIKYCPYITLLRIAFNIDIAKINVILPDDDRIMRNIICESNTQFLLYERKTQSHCVNHNGRLNINLR